LLEVVGKRLREHIETTFAVEPRSAQIEQSRLNRLSTSPFERKPGTSLSQARVQLDAFPGTSRNANALDSDILDALLARMVEDSAKTCRRGPYQSTGFCTQTEVRNK
jgi:hypothetical protein